MHRWLLDRKACTVVLVCAASIMVYAQFGSATFAPSKAAMAVWGKLPPNARVTGTDSQGIRHVELTEDLPESLDPNRESCHWLVWPMDNPKDADRFLLRSIHYTTTVVTPDGTFSLGVKQGFEATRTDKKQEGVLAYLCFDPERKGALRYPLPAVYQDALDKDILTPMQKSTLSSLNEVLPGRLAQLQRHWKDFSQATYVMYSRKRFLEALERFYRLAPGMSNRTLDPDEFFDRDQRTKLRSMGHQIRGRCILTLNETKLHLVLKHCPLSQLVSEWNRIRSGTTENSHPKGPMLKVADEHRHREIDGTVDMKLSSRQEAEKRALGLLLSIEGIGKAGP